MGWCIEFLKAAERDFAQLDTVSRKRIVERLDWLAVNIDVIVPAPLHGTMRDFYKLRIGDWRIIYQTNKREQRILVCYIGRRDQIYK